MTGIEFVKKHSEHIKIIIAAIVMSMLMAAFILAFRNGALPRSEDGDAFDTVYAVEQQNSNS